MAVNYIPAGYRSVTPALIVRRGNQAVDFYKEAFGAEEVSRMVMPSGALGHAEIRIGDSMVMLGEESPEWDNRSPETLNGTPTSLHIYVPDVDAAFAKALKAGATPINHPEDQFWGDRYAKVKDPFGHIWGLATHIKDLSETEVKAAADEWMKSTAASA